MEAAYAWWKAFQEKAIAYFAAVLLLGSTSLAVLEVIRRYSFGVSFHWQQDAVTFFILSGIFLFFSITQRRGAHLRVTVVVTLLRSRGRVGRILADVLNLASTVVSLLFVAFFVYWGTESARLTMLSGRKTESLMFPIWPFFFVFLIGFFFMAITLLFQVYREIQVLRGRRVLVEREEGEGPII